MLKKLKIKNFAIIGEVEITPQAGLNVFTGETGAGKSIIIEALSFVLGSRASTDFIKRSGEKLEVCASFDDVFLPGELTKKHNINGKCISLKRQLDKKGRSKGFINDTPVGISALGEAGDFLVDFHGQYEHQTLLKPQVQLGFLDKFAGLTSEVEKVTNVFLHRQSILKRLSEVKLSRQEKEKLLDLYKFQLDEIEDTKIKPNEDIELENLVPRIKNAHKLLELSQSAYEKLYCEEGSAVEKISAGSKILEDLSNIDNSLKEALHSLNDALTTVEEVANSVSAYRENIDIDSTHLDDLISRQDKIATLKKKYGSTVEDVLNYAEDLKVKISDLEFSDQKLAELEKQAEKLESELKNLCYKLHDRRMKEAKKLSAMVTKEIHPLGFSDVKFEISVEMDEAEITKTGADRVEFLFSSNPGEPPRPLKNIASGGEISRVMLGLKNVLSDKNIVSVFDEIDAGIGGITGRLVGEKLKKISKQGQMFVITHLPQIASFADTHYSVSKFTEQGTVQVEVTRLCENAKIKEISRMLGGKKDSQTSLKHAAELISQCRI